MALLADYVMLKRMGKVIFPYYCNGYGDYLPISEAEELIDGLNLYVDLFKEEEIQRINERNRRETHCGLQTKPQDHNNNIKKRNEGFVYLLKCGGKCKIGYSNNVERRIKELDTRPFPLELVAKVYSNYAYDIEQELHRLATYQGYRLTGEWYDFDMTKEDFVANVKCVEIIIRDNAEV